MRRLLLASGAAGLAVVLLCALAGLGGVAVTARSCNELDRRVSPGRLARWEVALDTSLSGD